MKFKPDPVADAKEAARIAEMKRAAREANRPPSPQQLVDLATAWGATLKPSKQDKTF